MLQRDIVSAVAEGASTSRDDVDQALELLTGMGPGARGADGRFPDGSVNEKVEASLRRFADVAHRFATTDHPTRGAAEDEHALSCRA
jgi:hypothetical protein